MTTEEIRQSVTEADVTAFGRKLAAWGEGLDPKERAILTEVVARAAAAEEDTRGLGGLAPVPPPGGGFERPTGVRIDIGILLGALRPPDGSGGSGDSDDDRPPRR